MINIFQNKSENESDQKVNSDFKIIAKKLDEQTRQVIKTEKQLYDTRDKLNKDIVSLKSLQKLTQHILLTDLGLKEVMNHIVKHLIYEMEFEKVLVFIYKDDKLELGSFGGYKEETVEDLLTAKFIPKNLVSNEIVKEKTLLFDFRNKDERSSSIENFIRKFRLVYFSMAFLGGRKGLPIGFLLAGYSKDGISLILPEITNEDVILFSNLADYVALFIENSQINEKLKQRVNELERFYRLTIDRELKMIELKKRLKN